jgi:hypothetical protein
MTCLSNNLCKGKSRIRPSILSFCSIFLILLLILCLSFLPWQWQNLYCMPSTYFWEAVSSHLLLYIFTFVYIYTCTHMYARWRNIYICKYIYILPFIVKGNINRRWMKCTMSFIIEEQIYRNTRYSRIYISTFYCQRQH